MQNKEKARQILKDGILNMSVERLVQLAQLGLTGDITMVEDLKYTQNFFNKIGFSEEQGSIVFMLMEEENCMAATAFCIHDIENISGCKNEEHPEELLNVDIELLDGTEITIRIGY